MVAPITFTDPHNARYFMSAPRHHNNESCNLQGHTRKATGAALAGFAMSVPGQGAKNPA
ncbi:hypothetical protein ABIB85_007814 [Bradyrhizobium sp. JR1.5]